MDDCGNSEAYTETVSKYVSTESISEVDMEFRVEKKRTVLKEDRLVLIDLYLLVICCVM